MTTATMTAQCVICNSANCSPVAELPFGIREGTVQSLVMRCGHCGCYFRRFDQKPPLDEHWDSQSYTSPHHEERFRRARQSFFESLAAWALAEIPTGVEFPRVLDVGCSYGHLLEIFQRRGCECYGIEPVERLRNRLNASATFTIYASIDEAPSNESYDVITLVDSLYYFPDPIAGLKELARRLRRSGVMVIRVTNRTPLLNLWRVLFPERITAQVFGDQLVAFSHRGVIAALRQSGLAMTSFRSFERKPVTRRGLA
jgi:SAM-dependent methyltransferase